ncbi:MAG: pyridoxamine 5'-phosphate oxidase family protein [Bacillota bacterium]|nr:pyridoxamine 5'-phosphate oxidase family protein [Bacillota bacterium]
MLKPESCLSEAEINEILTKAPVGNLALAMEDVPYTIPMNFVYHQGKIYFHCKPEGRKINYLEANPKACFQVSEVGEMIRGKNPCKYGYKFRSVTVEGVMQEVKEYQDKLDALEILSVKYTGPKLAVGKIMPGQVEKVRVFCLQPEIIAGKKDS